MASQQVQEIDQYCTQLNIASMYTDIATYDFHEVQMYAGEGSFNLYAKQVRKAGWTARGVVPMTKVAQGAFGETQQWEVLRSSDYWGYTWIHWKTPELRMLPMVGENAVQHQVRWTPKLGFYLIDTVEVSANEMVLCWLYPEVLDFESELLVDEGKYEGLMRMIGMRNELVNPYVSDTIPEAWGSRTLPETWVTTPLSAWFTKKHNDHIPVAALSFNTIVFKVKTRDLTELLVVDDLQRGAWVNNVWVPHVDGELRVINIHPTTSLDGILANGSNYTMKKVQAFGVAVQMPNRDRKVLAQVRRITLLIQQHQRLIQTVGSNINESSYDTRFVYPVRAIYFGLRNTTIKSEWANWSSHATEVDKKQLGIIFNPRFQANAVGGANIKYDNQTRIAHSADLFDHLMPYLCAARVPKAFGYNLFSYSADLTGNQPDGSANFSRVSQPSIAIRPAANLYSSTNTFNLHVMCVNWNHLTVSLGSSSFSAS